MDRCEDIEVHPEDGTIYAALTNNTLHGNFHGQVIRITEGATTSSSSPVSPSRPS